MTKLQEKTMDDKLICNICGGEVLPEHNGAWTLGHNPAPLSLDDDDRCCRECNDTYVTPARLWDSTRNLNRTQIKIAIDIIRSKHGVKTVHK